jgi:hypothetical protein
LGLGLHLDEVIAEAVDEATLQQFNDSIREMQATSQQNSSSEDESNDIKEAIKYHREIKDDFYSTNHPGTHSAPILSFSAALSAGIHKALTFSGKI